MYDNIDTLANKPEEIVTKMEADEARYPQEDDSEMAAMFLKLRMKWEKWNSKHSQQSRKFRDSGSENESSNSDGSSLESEKHCRRHTQKCYRCHKVGHIARYCPSTTVVESAAPIETAVATTTSIENYLMTVTATSPEKEGWFLDCATTSHVCRDRRKFERYKEYTKSDGQEIHNFGGKHSGQDYWTWRYTTETSVARRAKTWGCCEKCLACWRSTQLVATITAYGSGIADCPCQRLWNQNIRRNAERQCWRWGKSGERGTPDWRVILTGCEAAGCEGCRKKALSKRIIVWEEL